MGQSKRQPDREVTKRACSVVFGFLHTKFYLQRLSDLTLGTRNSFSVPIVAVLKPVIISISKERAIWDVWAAVSPFRALVCSKLLFP